MNLAKINSGYFEDFEFLKEFIYDIFPDLELPKPQFKVGGCPNFQLKPKYNILEKMNSNKYFFQIVGKIGNYDVLNDFNENLFITF